MGCAAQAAVWIHRLPRTGEDSRRAPRAGAEPVTIVILGPPDGLAQSLADKLDADVIAPEQSLPTGVTGAIVVAGAPPQPCEAAELRGEDWDHIVDSLMWTALTALQRARSMFASGGGRIVVVVPTVGMAGAPGLVPYTTAIEGIRSMAKSAARQWASKGVGVNLVAVGLEIFAPALAASVTHLTAPANNDGATLMHSVAESVKFLLRPDLENLAGETIVA